MKINLSYKIVPKGDIIDNYEKTLRGWNNKTVEFKNIHKLMLSSKIQYSSLKWNNGHKSPKQLDMSNVDCIIYDIDDSLSISQFQSLFKKYTYFLGTTKNHQKEKKGKVLDRYRVIFPVINISKDFDILMRAMRVIIPIVDEQTLTKTGAYLGNTDGIYIQNDGELLDMHKANLVAEKQLKEEYVEKIVIPKELRTQHSGSIDIDYIKDSLTRDITREILEDIGIEFEGYKCSLRDERTKSCKIYGYYLKDYGDDSLSGDIFQVLMDREDMDFMEAVRYVSNYV